MEKLWRKQKVTERLLNFIFDEGHCISQWGKFRDEYRHVGVLRYLIPETIPFYAASATFPSSVLRDVSEVLHLRPGKTEHIIRSNDRPEICLMARGLVYPAKGFQDLAFLIPDNFKDGDPPPPKFLIFFDNTKEAERATKYLQRRLPQSLNEKIKYFHSTMTPHYREDELEALRDSRTWGLCATDAFGMVCDSPRHSKYYRLTSMPTRGWTFPTLSSSYSGKRHVNFARFGSDLDGRLVAQAKKRRQFCLLKRRIQMRNESRRLTVRKNESGSGRKTTIP